MSAKARAAHLNKRNKNQTKSTFASWIVHLVLISCAFLLAHFSQFVAAAVTLTVYAASDTRKRHDFYHETWVIKTYINVMYENASTLREENEMRQELEREHAGAAYENLFSGAVLSPTLTPPPTLSFSLKQANLCLSSSPPSIKSSPRMLRHDRLSLLQGSRCEFQWIWKNKKQIKQDETNSCLRRRIRLK